MHELVIDTSMFDSQMERYQALLKDATPLMGLLAGLMHNAVEDNFAEQGRPRWLGLSDKTKKRMGASAGDHKILQGPSRRLASSVHPSHDANTARVSTNVVYAAIHQFGGTIQRHPMSGHVRLRTGRDGKLLRQADHPHLAVFAKAGHKQVSVKRWTRSEGWSIHIPARPFFSMTESDCQNAESEVSAYLRRLFD